MMIMCVFTVMPAVYVSVHALYDLLRVDVVYVVCLLFAMMCMCVFIVVFTVYVFDYALYVCYMW